MSLDKCINNGIDEGKITKEQGEKAKAIYERYKKQYELNLSPEDAQAKAGKDAFDEIKADAIHKKRILLKQAQTWKRILMNLDDYKGDPGKAYQAMMGKHDEKATPFFSNLEQRYMANRQLAFSYLDDLLRKFGRGVVGQVKNKAGLKNIVKEMFEESTDDISAKNMAKAVSQTFEMLRKQANSLGMRIPKLKKYGLPQIHHQLKLIKAGEFKWVDDLMNGNLLDMERMVDGKTGKPFSKEQLRIELHNVYKTITTQGLNKLKSGTSNQGNKSLANQRQEHRFLHFKDADSWMKYQEKYGDGDSFSVILNHIDSMARDITDLQLFGPNPRTMRSAIETEILKRASDLDVQNKTGQNSVRATADIKKARNIFDVHNNSHNIPLDGRMSEFFVGTRNILRSAQLGGAVLSAIADVQNMRIASKMTGLSQVKTLSNFFKHALKGLTTRERTQFGVSLGLVADNWLSTAITQTRFFGDTAGPGITATISDTVMRITGLSGWTQSGRQSFGMEFLAHMGKNVTKKFDDIDPVLKKTLERYGINKDDWAIISKSELREGTFVDVKNINELGENKTAIKILEAIVVETEGAVPSSSYRARATLGGGAQAGSIAGEISRSFGMYKNYPVTIYHTHIRRLLGAGRSKNRPGMFADWFIGVTLMGGLAIQAKQLSQGRDPRNMTDPSFWVSAIFQGGGLGIFGDFIASNINRFGAGIQGTIAGPVFGLLNDSFSLTFGNLKELAQGKDTNFGAELVKFIGRYSPGSNIWYTRLALERYILNNLQEAIDPKASKAFRRKEKFYRKTYDQKYWWKPGDNVPRRSPNIGEAFE